VICSSDEEYPDLAPDIFKSLRDKAIVVVTGNPVCIEKLKSKGIDNFIHPKSNLIEKLTEFNDRLGIIY
jgi:methylmalonyl-CoA mutase